MTECEALETVLGLAVDNALDSNDCDGDENLVEQAEFQDQAIEMVTNLINKLNDN